MLLPLLLCTAICLSAAPSSSEEHGHWHEDDDSVPHSVTEADVIRELLHHRGDVTLGLPKMDKPLSVVITLYLSLISEVNLDDGYVVITGYMTQIWDDPRLRFQYSPPFHTVQQVHLPISHIWKPDIELFDVAPPGVKKIGLNDIVYVDYNGRVRYYPMVSMPVFCDVISGSANESANESVSTLECQLKFGSGSYDTTLLDVDDKRDFDLMMTYIPKGQWVVTSITAQRNERTLQSLKKTYADVTYNITVAKRVKK